MTQQPIEATNLHTTDTDYLVFTASHSSFALPSHNLVQIVDRPQCAKMPNMPGHVRGAFDFMGKPMLLIDMRKLINTQSFVEEIDELVATIHIRKQNHLDWLNKLKDSVFHDKEITVETNPHMCAFGKWYDTFKTDSLNLNVFMGKFDRPHKTIHNLAVKAKDLIAQGQKSAAVELIHHTENNELNFLLTLFDSFEEVIRTCTYEYAIVLNRRGQQIALAVDDIVFFDKFDEVVPALPSSMNISADHLAAAIGRKMIKNSLKDYIIINCDNLHNGFYPHLDFSGQISGTA